MDSKNKKIEPIDRFSRFLIFCNELKEHPFVAKHKGGYTFQYTENFISDEKSEIETNFDETHLESLLTRVRQFVFKGELFYYNDVFDSAEKLLGLDQELKKFYVDMDANLSNPLKSGNVDIVKIEDGKGRSLIGGRTLKELMEARLYGGAIHSERLIKPEPGSVFDDFGRGDKKLRHHLNWELAGAAMIMVGNIWRFMNHIIWAARRANKINICSELYDLNERAKKHGT